VTPERGPRTRVLVVAASAVVRAGLESILLHAGDGNRFTVAGSVVPRSTLAEQLEELEPDVVLLELASPDEPLVLPAERGAPPAIVLLSDASESGWVSDTLRGGVLAILPRHAGADEIVAAVSAAAAGLVTIHPSFVESLVASPMASAEAIDFAAPRAGDVRGELTPREIEILRMLAEGLANKQIAARLGISEHTVKFHIASVYAKLGASSRTEAVRIGAQRGMVVF
jgi:two-component system, NarL family, response regulator YdfI